MVLIVVEIVLVLGKEELEVEMVRVGDSASGVDKMMMV